MVLLLLLFPIACLLAFAWALRTRLRTGKWSSARSGPSVLALCLGCCYLAAFMSLNLDPYYEDNGWPEFMELRYRWVWASALGGLLAMFVVPCVFAVRSILHARNARRNVGGTACGALAADLTFARALQTMAQLPEIERVASRYREPWRAYHDELHLSELKQHLLQAERDGVRIADGVAAYGFVLWHDAVYDPHAVPGRNEALSAQLCRTEFATIARPESVERACQAILATAGHWLLDSQQSPDAALLLDCDLAILAADPARFATYGLSIRREYAHVPDDLYRTKRSEVLSAFMRRERIFRTAWAWERWEAKARANLAA
jgi:predicted metal-dependent HD superfamily phosphohydrolase